MSNYSLGLDYGTSSVRALLVDVQTGEEVGTSVWNYRHGADGVVVDRSQPDLARQHPADYLEGLEAAVRGALDDASAAPAFLPDSVVGIGVDTTGSTPMPLDADGTALALKPEFESHPAAMAWLWKDHTAYREAAELSAAAGRMRPQFLAKCGGTYSSEWFWSKLLKAVRSAPEVIAAAHTWVELADWIPAVLTGTESPEVLARGVCAAGHKAFFHPDWGGYPDEEFLASLNPELARIRESLPDKAVNVSQSVGGLTEEWAARLGLPAGIPVAAGAFDAHLGAVGCGIQPGTLVKIIGTSTCDVAVWPLSENLPDIPGLCGIVPESVLPGQYGLEAGQSAVGDIFNWFVQFMGEAGHEALTRDAEQLRPGESGLLSLDWHNGNRTVLVDQRLTGLTVGQHLHTTPAEVYRSLIEATAFGARTIVERYEEYGVRVERVVNCGGISVKSPLVMQIYADVLNRPLEISRSEQTCALGAAMCGAVVGGAHADFASAARSMTGVLDQRFTPVPAHAAVYEKLYALYRKLHDSFGTYEAGIGLHDVMKSLLKIRDEVRS